MILNKKFQKDFLEKGYCIIKIKNLKSLDYIKNKIIKLSGEKILNNYHKNVALSSLNKNRLNIFKNINQDEKFRKHYFNIFESFLDEIIGNEISMQNKINLNIQIPKDTTSVLEMHADSYAGESNYEIISWLPIVNVYKTKSMYVLNLKKTQIIEDKLSKFNKIGTDAIFSKYRKQFKFLKINYGEALIFSANILHGNKQNLTKETRWSLNCRFKSLFAPANKNTTSKNFSFMYEHLKMKPATILGLEYKDPIFK
jgi:sporadic carbohydrate cluster 2OG-Fe(II) oxygenase